MITKWGVSLPTRSELPAAPHGVVLHWTGAKGVPNRIDREAYHLLVQPDATVVQGHYPVRANMRRLRDNAYAHHTGGFNSYRVGIAACGMLGYRSCSQPGPEPLTEPQVRRMCEVAAYFVQLAALDALRPQHVCTHYEVWTLLGIRGQVNHQKLDITCLPYLPQLGKDEVGPYLRGLVASAALRTRAVLRYGDVGPEVDRLQDLLGISGPDRFGPKTLAAVRAFQRSHGLVADGIVGPATWRALDGL